MYNTIHPLPSTALTPEMQTYIINFPQFEIRFFPGLPSYSLHKLTQALELPEFNHHRALDDALAAAEILKLAYNKVGPERLLKEVKNLSTPKKAKVV